MSYDHNLFQINELSPRDGQKTFIVPLDLFRRNISGMGTMKFISKEPIVSGNHLIRSPVEIGRRKCNEARDQSITNMEEDLK